jgi:D-alanyl-D-alanine carboxypeptidase (penicillin-binding protein 5/6)
MTPYDLALLSKRIIEDFPTFFEMFQEKEFTYNNIKQGNRNPLLYSYNFSDGLKTGYTEASGFSLAATASKSGRRLIAILSGMDSVKERKDETIKLFEWAFREYVNINLFKKQESVIEADVWLGNKAIVELITNQDINFTLRKKNINKYTAKVIYNNPIAAPIKTDTEYGKLIINNTLKGEVSYPLFAKDNIKKAGVFKKISSAFTYFIFGGYVE